MAEGPTTRDLFHGFLLFELLTLTAIRKHGMFMFSTTRACPNIKNGVRIAKGKNSCEGCGPPARMPWAD